MDCRILKNKNYKINQYYNSNHSPLDIINKLYIDYIVAHSDGIITSIQDNCSNINNYKGTAKQNTKMLNLLKQELLKY